MRKIIVGDEGSAKLNLTTNELYFIQELGRIRGQCKQLFTRIELLEKYIVVALKRDDWGDIDGPFCIRFAEESFEEAVARQKSVRSAIRRALGYT